MFDFGKQSEVEIIPFIYNKKKIGIFYKNGLEWLLSIFMITLDSCHIISMVTIWNCIDHFISAKRLTSKPVIDMQIQTQTASLALYLAFTHSRNKNLDLHSKWRTLEIVRMNWLQNSVHLTSFWEHTCNPIWLHRLLNLPELLWRKSSILKYKENGYLCMIWEKRQLN